MYQKEKRAESLFKEIIAENFPNLGKELDIQIQRAGRTPYYLHVKRSSGQFQFKMVT